MTAAVGVVAGSGLDLTGLLDAIDTTLPFSDLRAMPASSVAGHRGRFIKGWCGETPVIVQCGRLHAYEGFDRGAVAGTVDALHAMGARSVVFTNAAGGLLPEMMPGDLMSADCVRTWPYRRWAGMPTAITPDFEIDGCTWRGAYHWVHGPCYETRAEIAALRAKKSSAVGMSTAPEMLRAQQLGMRAAAVSCITNNCCTPQHLTHDHVLRTAAAASARLSDLLRHALKADAWRDGAVPNRNSAPSSR
jgi:purine-nucleoside phosphorylase